MRRTLAVIAVISICGLVALAQSKEPQWKDRAEYDLFESIQKEQNANTKLGLLQSWKEKYPQSEFKAARHQLMVTTYQQLGRAKEMFAAAKEMVADDPKSFFGLYWLNLLTISMNDTSAAALDEGEKAAKGLLAALDDTFSAAKKPAATSEDAWKKERSNMEALGNRTLGWVAMNRNNNEEAENYFLKVLALTPNDATVSSWTGTVILKQRKPEKQASGLYHLVRAAYHEGEGALPQAARTQLQSFVEKNYVNYHGSKEGLTDIVELARKSAMAPEGFKIKSSAEIANEEQQKFKESNPMLFLWLGIKKELAGPNGASYFESTIKGAALPGGAEGVQRLKGKVISQKPAARPKEVVVGIQDPNQPEVTLRFENPLPTKADVGTEIEWEGVAAEFTSEPFMLTMDVEPEKLVGWPAKAAPAPKKPAGGAKKGATKKK